MNNFTNKKPDYCWVPILHCNTRWVYCSSCLERDKKKMMTVRVLFIHFNGFNYVWCLVFWHFSHFGISIKVVVGNISIDISFLETFFWSV